MVDLLTPEERKLLLVVARKALNEAVHGKTFQVNQLTDVPEKLRQPGATFVTLTRHGELRGCIGALEPYLPLIEDVCEHAVAAGQQDFRFLPVQPDELSDIEIEISRLTQPQPLDYDSPADLLAKLKPGEDGVVLRDGFQRATFLPQVWEKLPDPAEFLNHLCQKMGAPANLWRHKKLKVMIYHVEEFHE